MNQFKNILSSRNKLLKLIGDREVNDYRELETWDQMFAERASKIIDKRKTFLEKFSEIFMNSYAHIAEDRIKPEILYKTSIEDTECVSIINQLVNSRRRDIALGTTGIGPQRDDYIISCEDRNFSNFASQGQMRTAAISFKLSEYLLCLAK